MRAHKTTWNLRLDRELCAAVEERLIDPIRDRPGYGLRGQLVDHLLKLWLLSEEGELRGADGTPVTLPPAPFELLDNVPDFTE